MRTLRWYTLIAMLSLAFTVLAQDDSFGDDVYSSFKSKKNEPKPEKVKPAKEEKETPVVTATLSSTRDIDEYNRRYVNNNDYTDERVADTLEYADGEVTQRIVKFHDPSKITIAGADNVNIYYDGETYEIDFNEPNNNAMSINFFTGYGYPYYAYSPWFYRGWYSPWDSWYGGWYDPWWYSGWYGWYSPWYYSWYSPWYYGGWYGSGWYGGGWYGSGCYGGGGRHNYYAYDRSSGVTTRSSAARDRSNVYNSSPSRNYSSRDGNYAGSSSRSSSARGGETVRSSSRDYSNSSPQSSERTTNARTRVSEGSTYQSGQTRSSSSSGSGSYSAPSTSRSSSSSSGSSGSYSSGGSRSSSSSGGSYSSGSSGGGSRSSGGGGGGGGGARSSGGGRR